LLTALITLPYVPSPSCRINLYRCMLVFSGTPKINYGRRYGKMRNNSRKIVRKRYDRITIQKINNQKTMASSKIATRDHDSQSRPGLTWKKIRMQQENWFDDSSKTSKQRTDSSSVLIAACQNHQYITLLACSHLFLRPVISLSAT
jgi:hypothetical protein